ncbi:hypothetical protein MKK58_17125 [Methylobacterium sp. J-078]|uniref:hypothetical protein n=1 Tax=Methylobacterium sp. J-078 TaxID=2836657 RepID=UPI001FBB8323|nr:hypothetical protein [Methylobacterium sp. J-078]MCJ2046241.1 hypothetical protein [Methylobacterium sp. J-078]
MRTVAEGGRHPILRGIRAGALAGLAIVAALSLPVFLVLGVKSSPPPGFQASARLPDAEPETSGRVWTEAYRASAVAAEPAPAPVESPRVAVDGPRGPALSLDLIPALDDGSGIGGLEERPVAKPARAPRTAAARAARSP